MDWPRRGVYFFREAGEYRGDTGGGPRVVRVGTHTSSHSKLWKRLYTHKGSVRSGGGSHRGSIFREIVGTALIKRDGHHCPSWDQPRLCASEYREREQPLEKAVSILIRDMPFLWLAVDDEVGPDRKCRRYIECNTIALLSNFEKKPLDPPSRKWLGRFCNRELVRKSGLWNQRHVQETYEPAFLDTLADLIERMEKTL